MHIETTSVLLKENQQQQQHEILGEQVLRVIRIEPEDDIHDVLKTLRLQSVPVLLSLPDHGSAFSDSSHFTELQEFMNSSSICFIIPSTRMETAGRDVYQHGFPFAPTIESAAPLLLSSTKGSQEEAQEPDGVIHADAPPPSSVLAAPPPPRHRSVALLISLGSICVLGVFLLMPFFLNSPAKLITIPPMGASIGQVRFSSSGQLDPTTTRGINDIVTVTIPSLKSPDPHTALYAWLLSDQTNEEIKPIRLGTITPNHGTFQFTYTDPTHEDLLVTYSAFRITEEKSSPPPIMPSPDQAFWRYSGGIAATPAPGDENHYSLLSHLRHLLAKDPNLQAIGLSGGLDIWLDRNSEKVLEYATAARDDWPNQGSKADLTHRQMVRILQYLDGVNYSWQDTPKGTPWLIDPQAGHIGLLDFSQAQEPPGYLSHVLLHLNGLINAPGSTLTQKQLAIQITAEMQMIVPLYQAIRDDARILVKMSDQQLRQPNALSLLDAVATKANDAYSGQFDSATDTSQSGINTIHGQLQTLATFTIMAIN